ncbi:hypothetical protein ACOSP7_028642 [Xanthoceras sorbifolium]
MAPATLMVVPPGDGQIFAYVATLVPTHGIMPWSEPGINYAPHAHGFKPGLAYGPPQFEDHVMYVIPCEVGYDYQNFQPYFNHVQQPNQYKERDFLATVNQGDGHGSVVTSKRSEVDLNLKL